MAKVKSIQELIELKQKIEKSRDVVKSYYAPSIDTDVQFKLASRVEIIRAREMEDEEMDPYIVYNNVVNPDLSDKALQETYNLGCQPHMIVDKLFTPKEVGDLSMAIIGQLKGDLVKDVKN